MQKLFDDLMDLCVNGDRTKFYFVDVKSPYETVFRIFNYNYASYTDWLKPGALECRGLMFEMDGETPVRIASRPMEKFFNLEETPFTMGLDFSEIELVMAKADGSLISSYSDGGQLCLKSKGSIGSEQAYFASQVINKLEYEDFAARVKELTEAGYTFNMEYVAPTNRVVLAYDKQALILLNVRNNETGEYVPYADLFKDAALRPFLVESYNVPVGDFVDSIRKTEGIEGFVFSMKSGLKFKLKTDWYCSLHRTKDSITKNEALFGTVVSGGVDDLKGMFAGDTYAIDKINEFEKVHLTYLRTSIDFITALFEAHKGKDRKDFVQAVQVVLNKEGIAKKILFGLVMSYYEKGIDYETIVEKLNVCFIKNWRSFVPEAYLKEVPKNISDE